MTDETGSNGKGPAKGGRTRSNAAFLLAQVGAYAAAAFAERLTALDLTPPHAGILRALSSGEGMSQQALCRLLSIMPSRLVVLLDELEEKKLVERRDDPGDRRSYALHLTESGRKAIEAMEKIGREHNEAMCAGLNAQDRAQLVELLQRVADRQGLTPGVHPGYGRMGRKKG